MKKLLICLIPFVMSCSTIDRLLEKGAEANDAMLKGAEVINCEAASIGSIRRKFNTPELAAMWNAMCGAKQGFTL